MFYGYAYETFSEWGKKRHGHKVLWKEDLQRTALKENANVSGSECQVQCLAKKIAR